MDNLSRLRDQQVPRRKHPVLTFSILTDYAVHVYDYVDRVFI
jgi:hypothetical protein